MNPNYYIIYNFFKYFLVNISIFIGLIWLSQIIRLLDFEQSLSFQFYDVIKTTILVLPSYLNPLFPFLILMSSYFLNFKIISNSEIIIIKQYLSAKQLIRLLYLMLLSILSVYVFNSEYSSVNFYQKYKIKEIDLRNNLKLGNLSQDSLHIDKQLSIFFENHNKNKLNKVEAVIYEDNQFIKSKYAEIQISKDEFNILFEIGERLKIDQSEKSLTTFDKFIYVVKNKKAEILLFDKEHFNTLGLIKNKNKEFKNYGYSRIIQIAFVIFATYISFKIILFKKPNYKSNYFYYFSTFIIFLILLTINNYLLYLLNNLDHFPIHYYFSIILSIIIFFLIIIRKFLNENN